MVNHLEQTKIRVNEAASKAVYKACQEDILPKQCYNNVFNVVSRYSSFYHHFQEGNWKVTYGYIELMPGSNLYGRHCFFLAEDGRVIDPTLYALKTPHVERDYIPFLTFPQLTDYLEAIEQNKYNPDLIRYTKQDEVTVIASLEEEGKLVIG